MDEIVDVDVPRTFDDHPLDLDTYGGQIQAVTLDAEWS